MSHYLSIINKHLDDINPDDLVGSITEDQVRAHNAVKLLVEGIRPALNESMCRSWQAARVGAVDNDNFAVLLVNTGFTRFPVFALWDSRSPNTAKVLPSPHNPGDVQKYAEENGIELAVSEVNAFFASWQTDESWSDFRAAISTQHEFADVEDPALPSAIGKAAWAVSLLLQEIHPSKARYFWDEKSPAGITLDLNVTGPEGSYAGETPTVQMTITHDELGEASLSYTNENVSTTIAQVSGEVAQLIAKIEILCQELDSRHRGRTGLHKLYDDVLAITEGTGFSHMTYDVASVYKSAFSDGGVALRDAIIKLKALAS